MKESFYVETVFSNRAMRHDPNFRVHISKKLYQKLMLTAEIKEKMLSGDIYAVRMKETTISGHESIISLGVELEKQDVMNVVRRYEPPGVVLQDTSELFSEILQELKRRKYKMFGYRFRGWKKELAKWFTKFEKNAGNVIMSRTKRKTDKPWHKRWNKKRGKDYKRPLSKARRRYAKSLLNFGKGKEPVGKESDVSYRGT